ncbi:MAG: cysteine peptidase family C39 domain-containing protein [Candidatus Pacebacteria bacterium]|nr:cysteine peptidase family C39 domain-containing protein [Candidatus Paceibacterota bacterium]
MKKVIVILGLPVYVYRDMHRARFAAIAALIGMIGFGVAPVFTGAQSNSIASSGTSQVQQQQQQQIVQLNQQIAQYQVALQQVGANKKTLQNAITTLNLQKKKLQTQVQLTQAQINAAQSKIVQLGKGIASDQQGIKIDQQALGNDIRIQAQVDSEPLAVQLLSAKGLSDMWNDFQDLSQLNTAVQGKTQSLLSHKSSLASAQVQTKQTQTALVAQKSTLASQQASVVATAQQKQQLLTQTNAQESKYQQLLAQAEAQLESFSNFSQNAGGSGILSNLTACDTWGCYYNQRDSQWGNEALNGTQYTMKSDGCLVTAMAMVMTHYGARGVTPETINSNSSNFAAYEPAYLLLMINAGGMTATRKAATIDATLASGNPVIVGLHALGGTHFVVLMSGSKGNYTIKDPYFSDGNNATFSEHYTMKEIYAIDKVAVS